MSDESDRVYIGRMVGGFLLIRPTLRPLRLGGS